MRLRRNAAFVRFWIASTVSDFGTYLTTVALSVLILVTLDGTALDQGAVNAARWLPYLLFGLLAGIWVDRFRRRTVLVAADLGRATVLTALCLLGLSGSASVPVLVMLMFLFGTLALAGDAAYQSFLPQLVLRPQLVRANARLQQSETVAQASGGAVAGAVVALVSAPFALLIDAISYLLSGLVMLTVPSREPVKTSTTTVRSRIAAGLRWIYGHRMLRPLALSTHVWFIGSAMLGTVLPALILKNLQLGALGLGLVLGGAGIGAVLGTTLSSGWGDRWGTGRVMVVARLAQPAAVVVVLVAPLVAGGQVGTGSIGNWPPAVWAAFACAALGQQFLFGLAMGAEGPLEMGYWQAVTPDALIARMSATRRSVNRGMIVVGAPLGGALATAFSSVVALGLAAAVMLVAALILALSPFRAASNADMVGPVS